uniref:Uncharacterized protein n=1 Tax=Anopheles albimanus TaxID=7167 RepID=A0A182FPT0_ANOAL
MTDINLDYLDEEEIMELLAMYLLMKKQRAAEKQNKRPDDNSEKFTCLAKGLGCDDLLFYF